MSDDPTRSYTRPISDEAAEGCGSGAEDLLNLTWGASGGGPPVDRTVPRRIGQVRLSEEIGRGGMGVVYRGWDEVLHRTVAVKFLLGAEPDSKDPHFEQFLEGARAEAAIRHANIVAVHTAGTIDGLPYVVMDYIDGPTLRDVLSATGRLSLAASVHVSLEAAAALAALHTEGFTHRDVKPANVLFDRDASLFVTDFGLAALQRRSREALSLAGTPKYMAPEAFDGRASAQTDVYAMGLLLFEMLAGRPAYEGDFEALRHQHCEAPLPCEHLVDGVPAAVVEIMERAAHKKEMFRYKTAEHFRRALRQTVATADLVRKGESELATLVTRTITRDAQQDKSEPVAPSRGSSYFDRLSQIAAQKRGSTEAAGATGSTDTAESETEVHGPMILEDLPCVSCGYNLRTLREDQRCPECGTPARRSTGGDRLTAADPGWLAGVNRGVGAVYLACCLAPACFIVAFLLGLLSGVLPDVAAVAAFQYLVPGGFFLAAALFFVGVVKITALDPRLSLTEQPVALRRFVRWAAVATLIALGTEDAVRWMASGRASGDVGVIQAGRLLLNLLTVLCALFALLGGLAYLARLARRVPDLTLASNTTTVARRLAILMLLQVLVETTLNPTSGVLGGSAAASVLYAFGGFVALGILVYAVRLVRLLPQYRAAFEQCLTLARRVAAESGAGYASSVNDVEAAVCSTRETE